MLVAIEQDAVDAGPRKSAPGSQRFCAATGEVKPVDQMIRFVVGPDRKVVPDLKRRLPGRGIWITATRQVLQLAIRRKSFERGLTRDIRVSPDLIKITERLLEQAALDALAMCNKAGKIALGFGRVEMTLAGAPVVSLLHAAEAAPEGIRKLNAALKHRADAAAIAVIEGFRSAQLDLALGRPNVIHAALLAGRESETFLARAARLACFRTGPLTGVLGSGKTRTGANRPEPDCDTKVRD